MLRCRVTHTTIAAVTLKTVIRTRAIVYYCAVAAVIVETAFGALAATLHAYTQMEATQEWSVSVL